MGLVFSSTQSTGSPSSPPIQDLRVWHRMYRALLLSLELFQKNGKPWVGGLQNYLLKHGSMMNTHLHVYTLLQQTEPSLEGTSQAATTSRQEHALIKALTKIGTTVISEDTPWPWRTGHGAVRSIEVEFLSCHTALCYPVKKQFVDSSCFLSWAWKCPLLEMKWEHPKWWVQCWLHIKLLQFSS